MSDGGPGRVTQHRILSLPAKLLAARRRRREPAEELARAADELDDEDVGHDDQDADQASGS